MYSATVNPFINNNMRSMDRSTFSTHKGQKSEAAVRTAGTVGVREGEMGEMFGDMVLGDMMLVMNMKVVVYGRDLSFRQASETMEDTYQ